MRKIKKVAELLIRVMTLNKNAPKEVFYCFDFGGHTKQVDFRKVNRKDYEQIIFITAYLDKESVGYSLSSIEKAIEKEEKLYAKV